MEEIWKDIPGYEGYYQASTFGRIRSSARIVEYIKHYKDKDVVAKHHFPSRIRKPGLTAGYRSLVLSVDGIHKDELVHRLIALTFIPNPFHLPQVDHIDGNRENNDVSNLRWVTNKENIHNSIDKGEHISQSYRNGRKVKCLEDGKIFETMRSAERYYNIPTGMISAGIRSGQKVHGNTFVLCGGD